VDERPHLMIAPPAGPSIPAARAYLVAARQAVFVQYNVTRPRRGGGYAIYFTILSLGGRSAFVVKVCEDVRGHVVGSSSVSDGEPSC
jgi:hypothetical protein